MAASDPRTDIPAVTRAGWRCPECKTVYSPDVRQCDCAKVMPSLSERIGGGISWHPGGAPRSVTAPMCNCPSAWHGIMSPPPCPAHGQTEMLRVTC